MRVTLVNAQVLDGNNVVPPLGLMYIAAVLEKAGHAVQIYDSDPEYQASMLKDIKDFNPDLIGLSFLTVGYQRALHLMQDLKKGLPDKIFCSGGSQGTTTTAICQLSQIRYNRKYPPPLCSSTSHSTFYPRL